MNRRNDSASRHLLLCVIHLCQHQYHWQAHAVRKQWRCKWSLDRPISVCWLYEGLPVFSLPYFAPRSKQHNNHDKNTDKECRPTSSILCSSSTLIPPHLSWRGVLLLKIDRYLCHHNLRTSSRATCRSTRSHLGPRPKTASAELSNRSRPNHHRQRVQSAVKNL